jgi:hypothetical protein
LPIPEILQDGLQPPAITAPMFLVRPKFMN